VGDEMDAPDPASMRQTDGAILDSHQLKRGCPFFVFSSYPNKSQTIKTLGRTKN
jgi:hypothetical protein